VRGIHQCFKTTDDGNNSRASSKQHVEKEKNISIRSGIPTSDLGEKDSLGHPSPRPGNASDRNLYANTERLKEIRRLNQEQGIGIRGQFLKIKASPASNRKEARVVALDYDSLGWT